MKEQRQDKRRQEKTREDKRREGEKTRREKKQDKRRDKMKREMKETIFPKMCQDPQTRQVNWPKMFRKIPVGRIIPPFFFESSESDRFFNYLHDSNSILRARGINSEWVSGGTVKLKELMLIKRRTTQTTSTSHYSTG